MSEQSGPTHSAAEAIAAVREHEAWAIIRRSTRAGDRDTVGVLGGSRSVVSSIMDIPLETGVPEPGRTCDRLVAVPFRQVAERGFEAHDDGTPLVVVDVDAEHEFSVAEVVEAITEVPVTFTDAGGFDSDDDEYAKIVAAIIDEEIGQGEGANLVIGRTYRAVVADFSAEVALTVYRRLLERERGAYWTFLFFTGDRYLIGASPERHVSVHGGDVRMNPISGTFHLRPPAGETRPAAARLRDFLADEKEIYELFMVVDEELKMMCDICTEGGQVLGPFLKPMTHLIHTEYLLAGRTSRDVREVLRDTMYAATVTGSPVENACKLIKTYEPEGRGYYGAALALFGRDGDGEPVVDSPIVIRTADVDLAGNLKVTAGATLVRDSEPAYEVAETHAKAGGILTAFGLRSQAPAAAPTVSPEEVAELVADEETLIALAGRNNRLSGFWLANQAGNPVDPRLIGRTAVILDNEDDFVNMLRHMLTRMGISSRVVRHEQVDGGDLATLLDADLVIVGPGPGDPRDDADPKIARLRTAVDWLLANERPFLAVCLGHQALCHRLGLPLVYKDIVFQGTQATVLLDGRPAKVGFYNTFVARPDADTVLPTGVTLDTDPVSGDVNAVTGPHYRGVQFHAESILTERGFDIVHDLVSAVLL
ncbi:chorismate-binding protein [Nocardioides sp. zg-536]|uniref:anthranilate synthase n=1 Tax=Nocardioides faecalis TaxID=2803858 RepID=A0A938Y8J6_9ACTN|nr:anthranilate synthase family protein [Nocardioides faecalis]MBM9459825.1 chorismate-binding protein [Nocardioides faecalis]QVI58934.1 chorismate-binding protein [Nocardioides faecalis]